MSDVDPTEDPDSGNGDEPFAPEPEPEPQEGGDYPASNADHE